MSKAMGWRYPFGLTALALALAVAAGTAARADVSTEQSGSILVFPKVVNAYMCSGGANSGRVCESDDDCDDSLCELRDTVIQISNTGNTLVAAHCFYTNAIPAVAPTQPPGVFNPPQCQETDFFIWLTRQQPTHWVASEGRGVDPMGSPMGLDPGLVPPVPSNFVGDLVCVEVGADGLPVSGNHLKGEATIESALSGDASKYSALAISAGPSAGGTGRDLQLDNDQYNSCPQTLLLNHFADGVVNPVMDDLGGGCGDDGACEIHTEITLVPCGRDYENQIGGRAQVGILVFNEFEERFSSDTPLNCWMNADLSSVGSGILFTADMLGTLTAYARFTPSGTSGGVLGVAEETHMSVTGSAARAAFNLQIEGSRRDEAAGRDIIDHIVLAGED